MAKKQKKSNRIIPPTDAPFEGALRRILGVKPEKKEKPKKKENESD